MAESLVEESLVEISEQRRFALSVMKFLFRQSSNVTPLEVENDIKEMKGKLSVHFSNGIVGSLVIHTNNLQKQYDSLYRGMLEFDSNHCNEMLEKLENSYTHEMFLSFMSWYGLKCTMEYSCDYYKFICGKIEALTLSGIIQKNAWCQFKRVVREMNDINCATSLFYPAVLPYFLLDMNVEQKIIFEIMLYIFTLYTNNIPRQFKNRMFLYTEDFSNAIKNTINALDVYSIRHVDLIGWDKHAHDLDNEVKTDFSYNCFFEFCYCISRISVLKFYNDGEWMAPMNAFGKLVVYFKHFKEQGYIKSETYLEELKKAGQEISQEVKERFTSGFPYYQSLRTYDTLEPPRSDSYNLRKECCGDCRCS